MSRAIGLTSACSGPDDLQNDVAGLFGGFEPVSWPVFFRERSTDQISYFHERANVAWVQDLMMSAIARSNPNAHYVLRHNRSFAGYNGRDQHDQVLWRIMYDDMFRNDPDMQEEFSDYCSSSASPARFQNFLAPGQGCGTTLNPALQGAVASQLCQVAKDATLIYLLCAKGDGPGQVRCGVVLLNIQNKRADVFWPWPDDPATEDFITCSLQSILSSLSCMRGVNIVRFPTPDEGSNIWIPVFVLMQINVSPSVTDNFFRTNPIDQLIQFAGNVFIELGKVVANCVESVQIQPRRLAAIDGQGNEIVDVVPNDTSLYRLVFAPNAEFALVGNTEMLHFLQWNVLSQCTPTITSQNLLDMWDRVRSGRGEQNTKEGAFKTLLKRNSTLSKEDLEQDDLNWIPPELPPEELTGWRPNLDDPSVDPRFKRFIPIGNGRAPQFVF